jgi:phosphoenolpyruvate carboxykinase (GTP)
MRILKWIVERCAGRAGGSDTPLGVLPRFSDLDWEGMEDYPQPRFEEICTVDSRGWGEELMAHDELFARLGSRMPPALEGRRGTMHKQLAA